jgi:hypothetical protein
MTADIDSKGLLHQKKAVVTFCYMARGRALRDFGWGKSLIPFELTRCGSPLIDGGDDDEVHEAESEERHWGRVIFSTWLKNFAFSTSLVQPAFCKSGSHFAINCFKRGFIFSPSCCRLPRAGCDRALLSAGRLGRVADCEPGEIGRRRRGGSDRGG